MAKTAVRHEGEITTRDKHNKVVFQMGMTVEGRELPSASVLGAALEEAVELVQQRVTESYQVPPRVADTAHVTLGAALATPAVVEVEV